MTSIDSLLIISIYQLLLSALEHFVRTYYTEGNQPLLKNQKSLLGDNRIYLQTKTKSDLEIITIIKTTG